jgi:hypothetical protein
MRFSDRTPYVLLLLSVLVGLSACASPGGEEATPCMSDLDCKGDRVCRDGVCVDPVWPADGGDGGTTMMDAVDDAAPADTTDAAADAVPADVDGAGDGGGDAVIVDWVATDADASPDAEPPADIDSTLVLQGSLTIENAEDVARAARYAEITGDLIFVDGPAEVELPDLLRVRGELELGGRFEVVRLPRLIQVGSLSVHAPSLSQLQLPELQRVDSDAEISAQSLAALSLPSLVEVGPNPPGLSGRFQIQASDLSALDLPKLERVGSDMGLALIRNTGSEEGASVESLTLARLESGSLWFEGCVGLRSLSFPVLHATPTIYLVENAELQSAELPLLTDVSAVTITDNPQLPQCWTEWLAAWPGLANGSAEGNREDCTCAGTPPVATCPDGGR